jgi:hypothetical protein
LATTFIETFDGGSNTGGWTFHVSTQQIRPSGGNPGAHLHCTDLDAYAPQPGTTQPSIFTGSYRGAGVTAIGVDLLTVQVDFSAEDRPLTLMLYSNNGTPGNTNDDWAAYNMGPNVPLPGEGWKSYDFAVPSTATSLPAGWLTLPLGASSPPNPDWNLLMTGVAAAGYFYGDPQMFFVFQMWELGLDNPRITCGDPASTGEPAVAGPGLVGVSPNPSGGQTGITLRVPAGRGGNAAVCSVDGRTVASWTIMPGAERALTLSWDGHAADGSAGAAGVYFVRARLGSALYTGKFVRLAP